MRNLCPGVERDSSRNPGFPRARYHCVRAAPVYSMRKPIRPQNGPFLDVSTPDVRKPVEASFPLKNAKKRPFSQSVTICHQMCLMARTFARMGTHAGKKASPTSRGYWGYWGYFSQSRENTGLFARPRRGYFGGYFRGRGFLAALLASASMRRPKIATLRRIRWGERPETRETSGSHMCAQDTLACALRRSIRCYRPDSIDPIASGNPYNE